MKKRKIAALITILPILAALTSSTKASNQNTTPPIQNPPIKTSYQVIKEKPPKPNPKTLEDYTTLYSYNLKEEANREKSLRRYTAAKNVIQKYNLDNPRYKFSHDEHYPTEDEMKQVSKPYLITLNKALKQTRRDSPDIQDFEDHVTSMARGFYLSVRGPNSNGRTNSATLNEKRRQEKLERENKFQLIEATIKEWGNRYRVVLGGEFDYNYKGTTLTDFIQGFSTQASIDDFEIHRHKFHSAKIKVDASQKVKAYITKNLGNNWYTTGACKFDCFPGNFEYTVLGFTHEVPNSRLTIGIGRFENDTRVYTYFDYEF